MPILTILALVLLVGSFVVAFVPGSPARSKTIALLFALATFALTIVAITQYDTASPDQFQLVDVYSWIPSLGLQLRWASTASA